MKKKISVRLAGLILLGALLASACTQQYSQAPLATPTLIPTGLFVSPFPAGQDPMQVIANLGTQTALASGALGTPVASATLGTPATAGLPGGTMITPLTEASLTPTTGTPGIQPAATTPAPITVVPGATTAAAPLTVVVPSGRPATYTLNAGEFPYCIARRFDLNPPDLLALNNLTDGTIYKPGLTLTIPRSGSFPGPRAWHAHPDTYTVDFANETLYSIACYYGDVSPEAIAKANGLSLNATLSPAQKLSIP